MSGASARKWRQAYPAKSLVYDARRRAKLKRLPFNITAEYVAELLDAGGWCCVYCDTPVGTFVGGQRPNSVTLDRLIPELGYVPRNTVIACHLCNCSKAEHTPESFRAWADLIETVINWQNQRVRIDVVCE